MTLIELRSADDNAALLLFGAIEKGGNFEADWCISFSHSVDYTDGVNAYRLSKKVQPFQLNYGKITLERQRTPAPDSQ